METYQISEEDVTEAIRLITECMSENNVTMEVGAAAMQAILKIMEEHAGVSVQILDAPADVQH